MTTLILISGILFALFIIILIYRAVYKKIPPGAALVVSKDRETKVYLGSRKLINPFTSKAWEISLSTLNLEVECKGTEALITKNNSRVNVTGEFSVKIQPEDLRENQHEFELAIEAACQDDLKQNGFTLETVSITHLAHP